MFWLLPLVAAQVYVGFPLDEQLPNIARPNEAYRFQMADQTYKLLTPGTAVEYSISNQPAWLQFDPLLRTFSGTPLDSDLGQFLVVLHGRDPLDQTTLENQYNFMVSSDPGLQLSSSNWDQTVKELGRTTGPGSQAIVVKEGQELHLQFSPNDFVANGDGLKVVNTYGRLADRLPLPPWLKYDPSTYTFSGTVPQVTLDLAPQYDYLFVFIGTDINGYAAAEGQFRLVVGANLLLTNITLAIAINGLTGSTFDAKVPLNEVFLNDQPIARANVSKIEAQDLPLYAKFSDSDLTITGTFPLDKNVSDSFTVVVTDQYLNQVQLPFTLTLSLLAFTSQWPDTNATRGEWWGFNIGDYLTDKLASVSVNSLDDWMTWHSDNDTVNGLVPDKFQQKDVDVSVAGELRQLHIKGVDPITMLLLLLLLSSSSSSSSLSALSSSLTLALSTIASTLAAATATSSDDAAVVTGTPQNKSGMLNLTKLAIGLGVGLPVGLLAVAAVFLFCCCWRRRRDRAAAAAADTLSNDLEKHSDIPSPYGDKFPENLATKRLALVGLNDAVMAAGDAAAAEHAANFNDEDDPLPKQLAALKALEFSLPKKAAKFDLDIHLTLSLMTRIELDDLYFDATEKPLKLWRAADWGDLDAAEAPFDDGAAPIDDELHHEPDPDLTAAVIDPNVRNSDALMLTVNTDQLFSVRLVDDGTARDLAQLVPPLTIRRDNLSGNNYSVYADDDGLLGLLQPLNSLRRRLNNLDVLVEEGTPGAGAAGAAATAGGAMGAMGALDSNRRALESLVYYTGASGALNPLELLLPDLLEKANRKLLIRTDDVPYVEAPEDVSGDDFIATATPEGIMWEQAPPQAVLSPSSEGFNFTDSPVTLKNSLRNSTLLQLLIGTGNLTDILLTKNPLQERLGKMLPTKAKLVEFTRKGSLRDQPTLMMGTEAHHELVALIRENDLELDRSSLGLSIYQQ